VVKKTSKHPKPGGGGKRRKCWGEFPPGSTKVRKKDDCMKMPSRPISRKQKERKMDEEMETRRLKMAKVLTGIEKQAVLKKKGPQW